MTGVFTLSSLSLIRSRADAHQWLAQRLQDVEAACKV